MLLRFARRYPLLPQPLYTLDLEGSKGAHCAREQIVSQLRVASQHRPMHVGGYHRTGNGALYRSAIDVGAVSVWNGSV